MVDKIAEALGIRPLDKALAEDAEDAETIDGDDEDLGYSELVNYEPDQQSSVEIYAPGGDNAAALIEDIEEAKKNVSEILREGTDAFKELISIAKQSEAPQAFQVAANMMETLLKANKDFIDVAEKQREVRDEDGGVAPAKQTNVTQNNLIVTTNSLLEQMLEKRRKD